MSYCSKHTPRGTPVQMGVMCIKCFNEAKDKAAKEECNSMMAEYDKRIERARLKEAFKHAAKEWAWYQDMLDG